MQHASPKHFYIYSNIQGVVSEEKEIFISTSVRTTYLAQFRCVFNWIYFLSLPQISSFGTPVWALCTVVWVP